MTKNSRQRRFGRARAEADANGTSVQFELQRLTTKAENGSGSSPANSSAPSRRHSGSAVIEQWALLDDLSLAIPDSLPRLGSVFIAEVVESWNEGSHEFADEGDDSDVTYYEEAARHVVRLGGWLPGRRAKKLLVSGQASLSQGDSGVDQREGVPVEFPDRFTLRSTRQVAVIGLQEEPQDLNHHWVTAGPDDDPHPWHEV